MPRGSNDGSIYHRMELRQHKPTKVWFARARYTDRDGRERELKRRAVNYADACRLKRKLVLLAREKSQSNLDTERLTFADLVAHYRKHYAVAAEYVDGRKVAGLRSLATVEYQLTVLENHFKKKLLASITYGDVRSFRAERLKALTIHARQRSIASVNRELALLRRVFNVALREGWIARNPFTSGESLISYADERRRERVLSLDEETSLLEACAGRRAHLRPVIVAALDTGMRLSEILKLRWSDIDHENQRITVRAFNTKTLRAREIGITARLSACLLDLARTRAPHSVERDPLVFGIGSVKKSFAGACREAKITGLRFHDLRHTHGTALDDLGFSLAKIGQQLGHTQVQTTLRYVNRDKAKVNQVAAALDQLHAAREEHAKVVEAKERVN
ncbi:MAG: site-specific integrase [Acidobacteriota bacterium]|nr:site-specific integrase [Acidobacteriota bacterium]